MTRLYANTSVSTITIYIMCLFLFTHPCLFTGKGTTHCTNCIVVQRKPHMCALPPIAATNRVPSKKRSVNFVASDVLHFISSSRQGPGQLKIDVNNHNSASIPNLLTSVGDPADSPTRMAYLMCRRINPKLYLHGLLLTPCYKTTKVSESALLAIVM